MPKAKGAKRSLTFEDLIGIERIGSISVSPMGTHVIFDTSSHDPVANKVRRTVRMLNLRTKWCPELTPGPGNHHSAVWAPNAQKIAFVSNREKEKGSQLWVISTGGGEAERVTDGYDGVINPVWAPDSKRVAFTRSVVVSTAYDQEKDEPDPAKGPEKGKVYGLVNEKSSARIADELLFRHWDSWRDRKRNHIFILDLDSGRMTDVTPFDIDAPPISLDYSFNYDFSPEGDELVFVMNPDEVVARSTNNSIFIQKLDGIEPVGEPVCISNSDACDGHPRYTEDGKSIVYLAMEKAGYESDKNRIKVYNRETGETKVYLERFDRSPNHFVFAGDAPNHCILFTAQDKGHNAVYRLNLKGRKLVQLTRGTTNGALCALPAEEAFIVSRQSATAPYDLFRVQPGKGIEPDLYNGPDKKEFPEDADATATRLTTFADKLEGIEMNPAEEFWYPSGDKRNLHGFLIKPPKFNPRKKYPLILLIHGGPQGAFMDEFHYRWNAQMFAATDSVVAFFNPRGSTSYGQKFTDQISGDWGGRCYDDLMRGLDYLLKTYKFIDEKRVGAAGASFGGFMVNWIAGHTDRFKALVCHDGVFFAETMAYTTEELWFDEHEHGGFPHENRKSFVKFSPHMHVANFKTPTLVVHGGKDFRCPISEGIGMFTALQVMGVPSRFLHFPDEGHWVMQPANAQVWYHEVLGWLSKYLAK